MKIRSPGRRALWVVGGIALATLGYAGARAASASPQTGHYEAETRWGGEGGGVQRVEVDVSHRGRGRYVEYSIHMDPPGQTAGCRARAEQDRRGQLEFSCNDGWNDVRGRFRGSRDAAVLQVDNLDPGGGGLGAFYGEHTLRRTAGARDTP